MRIGLAAAILLLTAGARAAVPLPPERPINENTATTPMPMSRPEEAGPPIRRPASEPFGPPAPPGMLGLAEAREAACLRVLASGKVLARRQPAILGPGACGMTAPISLQAVVLQNGRRIALEPPALMRCDLADRLADWLRDDVSAFGSQEGDLLGLVDASAYACRSRNHQPGAPLSEHGLGDAIDIVAFRFAHQRIGLKDAASRSFLVRIKETACLRFSTVLGPGSDGYHEDNLHLDLENRQNGSHYCHWEQS